jgi:hypothetical protein
MSTFIKLISVILLALGILDVVVVVTTPDGVNLYHMPALIIGLLVILLNQKRFMRACGLSLLLFCLLGIMQDVLMSCQCQVTQYRQSHADNAPHIKHHLYSNINTCLFKQSIRDSMPQVISQNRSDNIRSTIVCIVAALLPLLITLSLVAGLLSDHVPQRMYLIGCAAVLITLFVMQTERDYRTWKKKLWVKTWSTNEAVLCSTKMLFP